MAIKSLQAFGFLLILIVTEIVGFKIPDNYDASLRPNIGAVADYVRVSVKVLSIRDIKPDSNSITADVILEQQWKDSRLAGLTKKDIIWSMKHPDIWVPDLYFLNSVTSMKPEENSVALTISPDGSIDLKQRFAATISCAMSFAKFPFDNQACHLSLSSYSYTNIHLDLIWHGLVNEAVPVFDSEYRVTGLQQNARNIRVKEGTYVRLTLTVFLSRSGLRYMIRAFLPTIVFALISYGTLYVEERRVGEIKRNANQLNLITLGLNSLMFGLMILVGQVNFVGSPRTATITGLDIWMVSVGLLIFLCFLLKLLKVVLPVRHHGSRAQHECLTELAQKGEISEPTLSKIERYLRISLPIIFILYIIIFFAIYLS